MASRTSVETDCTRASGAMSARETASAAAAGRTAAIATAVNPANTMMVRRSRPGRWFRPKLGLHIASTSVTAITLTPILGRGLNRLRLVRGRLRPGLPAVVFERRRIALVLLAAAPLEVGIPRELVAVQRRLVDQPGRVQQLRA